MWGSEGGVLSIRGKSGRGGVEKGEREKGHRDMDSGSDHGLGLGFCLLGIVGFKVALRERKARRGL